MQFLKMELPYKEEEMYNEDKFKEILKRNPIIPVVVIERANTAKLLGELFLRNGMKIIEVTLRTAEALEAIKILKKECADLIVGVGTVTNVEQFKLCEEIGVDFVVSPGITEELLTYAKESSMYYLPGVMTSSEVLKAKSYGFNVLKLFPAMLAGGLQAVNTYGAVYANTYFCPTGGISEENYRTFLDSKYVVAVGGTWIAKQESITQQDVESIEKNLRKIKKGE